MISPLRGRLHRGSQINISSSALGRGRQRPQIFLMMDAMFHEAVSVIVYAVTLVERVELGLS